LKRLEDIGKIFDRQLGRKEARFGVNGEWVNAVWQHFWVLEEVWEGLGERWEREYIVVAANMTVVAEIRSHDCKCDS